jgi:DNA-binding NarL/FixJ family response regulator
VGNVAAGSEDLGDPRSEGSPGCATLGFACDDAALCQLLAPLLPGLYVEHVAAGEALVERARLGQFRLVVLGPSGSCAEDLALIARIKASAPGRAMPLVLRARGALSDALRDGCAAGADDVLSAELPAELLALRLHMLLRLCDAQGKRFRAARIDLLMNEHIEALACEHGLSTREREVLRLLVLGRTPQDIGVALGITARTAKFHQSNLLAKLGAESKFDLVRLLF